ncbi:helix-turn-helix domain-containing protein [Isosphaeraceae bacterium EP7]
MSRRKIDPLRPLTDDEAAALTKLSRSKSEPAARVARASLILAVARGDYSQRAAEAIGRRSGDAVSHLVARFNADGLAALDPRHGGGRGPVYDGPTRERILRKTRRRPTPEADGTAAWSLVTLQKALRSAGDGLPRVSTYTIWRVLHEAGASPQKARSWCPTGTVLRQRKDGPAVVTDPDTSPKTTRAAKPD